MNAGPVGMVDSLEGVAARATEPDWPQLGRYRDANRALEGIPQKLVFIGDSITAMWQAADPALLGKGIVTRGISGQTTPQMLLRLDRKSAVWGTRETVRVELGCRRTIKKKQ